MPQRSGFHKRRERLSDTIEELIGVFAADSPGYHDDLVLVDSTPVECGRSVETRKRSQLADAADYGYCVSHSRLFWGFRLHGLFGLTLSGGQMPSGVPEGRHDRRPHTNGQAARTSSTRGLR